MQGVASLAVFCMVVAAVHGKVCYTCGYDPNSNQVPGCGATFERSSNIEKNWKKQCNDGCYTMRYRKDGEDYYQRGCSADLPNGCESGSYDFNAPGGGTYPGDIECCCGNKCNGDHKASDCSGASRTAVETSWAVFVVCAIMAGLKI